MARIEKTIMSVFPKSMRGQWWALLEGEPIQAFVFGPRARGKAPITRGEARELRQLAELRLGMLGRQRSEGGLGNARQRLRRLLEKIEPQWCHLRVPLRPGQAFSLNDPVSLSATSFAVGSIVGFRPAPGYAPAGRVAAVEADAVTLHAPLIAQQRAAFAGKVDRSEI
jgi:hypothetical protein